MFTILLVVILCLWGLSYILPVELPNTAHGSARWQKHSPLSLQHDGLVIDGKKRITAKDSFTHSLTIAPTGGGKTTRFILPNIINVTTCSQVISDPKGELLALTRPYLEGAGCRVLVLDFENLSQSIRFNPLHRANTESEIKQLAQSFFDMANAGAKTEGIWRMGAIRLLSTLIISLKHQPDKKLVTMSSLLNLLNRCEDGTDTVEQFVNTYAPKSTQLVFKAWQGYDVKVKMGQLASAIAALASYDTTEIRNLTNADTIRFEKFRTQKTVLFLKLPVGVSSRYAPVLNLFYTQFFRYLLNTDIDQTALPIYFLLDEFANLKKVPDFSRTLTLIRSRRVSINVIVQSLNQLDAVYGKEDAETIIGNCASLIAYAGIRDKRSLEFLSQMLGQTTKEMFTPGSFGVRTFSRSLMTIDEIRTMPSHKGLFIFGNRPGEKITPTPIFKNPALMKKAGLQSINGELVPLDTTPPTPSGLPEPQETAAANDFTTTLEEHIENSAIRDMKERLKELLP